MRVAHSIVEPFTLGYGLQRVCLRGEGGGSTIVRRKQIREWVLRIFYKYFCPIAQSEARDCACARVRACAFVRVCAMYVCVRACGCKCMWVRVQQCVTMPFYTRHND